MQQEFTQPTMIQKCKAGLCEIEKLKFSLSPFLEVPTNLKMSIGVDVLII